MSDKDKLANALNAMMSGQSEPEHVEEVQQHEPVAEPAAPEPSRPAPVAPRLKVAPAPLPVPAQPPQATRTARPAAPAIASPAASQQTARSSRPVGPSTSSAPAATGGLTPQANPSAANAPTRPAAPPASAVNYAPRKVAARKNSGAGSLQSRQTLIPPCLVVGGSFLILAIGFFLQPSTAALRHASLLIPIALGVLGAALLALGVLNMLMVKKELERQK